MLTLNTLQSFLDNLLFFEEKIPLSKIDPLMANGLVVKGKEEIRKIGFGVSASLAFFEAGKKDGYDALIVHHSFLFPSSPGYDTLFQRRFSFLTQHRLSLFAYHFLLDAHPQVGNNVQILKKISAQPKEPYFVKDAPWGFFGEYEKEKDFSEIKEILEPYFTPRTKIYHFGPEKIKRVVVCSGKGAPSSLEELLRKKVDLFITGEVQEWVRELFREAGINFLALGHYNSETFGIKALMGKIKEEFQEDIEVGWIDLANDV